MNSFFRLNGVVCVVGNSEERFLLRLSSFEDFPRTFRWSESPRSRYGGYGQSRSVFCGKKGPSVRLEFGMGLLSNETTDGGRSLRVFNTCYRVTRRSPPTADCKE